MLFDITAALLAERVKMCGSDARTSEKGNLSTDSQESSVMEQKRKKGISEVRSEVAVHAWAGRRKQRRVKYKNTNRKTTNLKQM